MLSKQLLVEFLDNAGVSINGKNPYDLKVKDPRFFSKLMLNPSLGAGETYMAGWWDCDQLDELFNRICRSTGDQNLYQKPIRTIQSLQNIFFNLQNRIRSKQVADVHYNLGNDLYQKMLGKSMAYTCGYWKDANNLDKAQFDKFDLVCRKVGIQQGDRVLDLGCGWGSFAKYAAENYGCEVVAVNISEEQVRYANENNKHLPNKFYLCDYRDDHIYNPRKIKFDKVVSIGLCEHIGHKNYGEFLNLVRNNLKDEGLFLLHTIGKNESSHFVDPWINKYIFPNGILPSIKLLGEAMEHVFILEDLHNFGADYDKTLLAWHKNFNDNWESLKEDYSETFFRLWNYYLLSCAGGFRSRGMQLWQMVLSPKGVLGGYKSIR